MKTVFSTLSIATAALSGPALADTADHGLDGAWHSMACEVRPQVGADGAIAEWWLTREITFAENRIDYAFFDTSTPLDQGLFTYLATRERLSRVR